MTNNEIIGLALVGFATLLSAVIGVMWAKADKAEKIAESNKAFLGYLIKNLDKTDQLTERMSSLEMQVGIEIKNLSVSIKRLEGAILRINKDVRNRPY